MTRWRLIRFASEDVGMADPQALVVCVAAQQAAHFVGMPECALAQAVVHLACAPKSNALYTAYDAAVADVRETRNAPRAAAPAQRSHMADEGAGLR